MNHDEAVEICKAIGEQCSNEEEVREAVKQMPLKEKMQIVYQMRADEYFEDSKYWSIWLLDFIEAAGLVNDQRTGTSRREAVTGFLRLCTELYKQSANDMYRRELQTQTRQSQYGMKICEETSEIADALAELAGRALLADADYASILQGRRCDYHFTDAEGNGVPYSKAELRAIEKADYEYYESYQQQLQQDRQVLEDAYWNKGELPEVEPGGIVQLVIPLWSVGFTPEKAKEEPVLTGSSGVGFS